MNTRVLLCNKIILKTTLKPTVRTQMTRRMNLNNSIMIRTLLAIHS